MDITSYLLGKNASGGGGGGGINWSALGLENPPKSLQSAYNYSLDIKNNWLPATDLSSKYSGNDNIVYFPQVDTSITTTMQSMFHTGRSLQEIAPINTSNVTTMKQMFYGCVSLRYVPVLDTSNIASASGLNQMFNSCKNLTNESLDNILQMAINAVKVTSNKTLAALGLSSTYYPASTIQALPHYQDFIDAGWTIGY